MAWVSKKPLKSGRYRAGYVDRHGRNVQFTGTKEKRPTLKAAERFEGEELEIKLRVRPEPLKFAGRATAEAVQEYIAWGNSAGGRHGMRWSRDHARHRETQLAWWTERLRLNTLGELPGMLPRVEGLLRELQLRESTGKTLASYLESIRAFCAWLVKRGYLEKNPLENATRFDTRPLTKRRALTPDEIARLLKAAPPERRLVYETALATGFRASELRALRVGDLDARNGMLHLAAASAKNRQDAYQTMPGYLADRLAAASAGKADTAPLLTMKCHAERDFNVDREAAGIDYDGFGGVCTFHGLRHTAITLANECGASVKALQGFARHSDPRMTMGIYAHERGGEQGELAEKMGAIIAAAVQAQDTVSGENSARILHAQATGTDGGRHNIMAAQRMETGGGPDGTGVRFPRLHLFNPAIFPDTSASIPAPGATFGPTHTSPSKYAPPIRMTLFLGLFSAAEARVW